MLKKLALILIAVVIVGGLGWILYQELFVSSTSHFKDVQIVYTEGELRDKQKVTAECSIERDGKFCFKDENWEQKENNIEFKGYAVVEYTNNSDLVTEVSTGTAKLSNVTKGQLIISGTEPSNLFVPAGDSVSVRYDISFDVDDEETANQVRTEGIELKATLTNEIGKSASTSFIVEYKN